MDVYGGLSVDDLLDLPTDDFFPSSSSSAAAATPTFHHPSSAANSHFDDQSSIPSHSADLSDILCVPVRSLFIIVNLITGAVVLHGLIVVP